MNRCLDKQGYTVLSSEVSHQFRMFLEGPGPLSFSLHPMQYLPKEELYAPPLNIRILDKRNFGRMPMVGTHIIKSLKDFHVEPVLSPEERAALKGVCVHVCMS